MNWWLFCTTEAVNDRYTLDNNKVGFDDVNTSTQHMYVTTTPWATTTRTVIHQTMKNLRMTGATVSLKH